MSRLGPGSQKKGSKPWYERSTAPVTVPGALRGYEVERTSAAVYDRLLVAAPPGAQAAHRAPLLP